MALVQSNITVGTTPTLLATIPSGIGYITVAIYNGSAASIFVGGPSVGSASSFVRVPAAELRWEARGYISRYDGRRLVSQGTCHVTHTPTRGLADVRVY
jgi:hypothetical protein